MKYAYIEHGKIKKIVNDSTSIPSSQVSKYQEVDDTLEEGWRWQATEEEGVPEADWVWSFQPYTRPIKVVIEPIPNISPIQFKLLFMASERVALNTLRATDPIINDWMELLNDPRMEYVDMNLANVNAAIDYMVLLTVLTPERAVQIKAVEVPPAG